MDIKMALSFSRLNTFEQCQKKFEYLYVLKSVQDAGSSATEYGTRVHEALEHVAKGIGEHTTESLPFAGILDKILAQPGNKFFEHQMSIDCLMQPCDWYDQFVWVRSIADVLIIDGDTAWIGDYKTGKVKEDITQLQLFAWMVMQHFPQVNTVKASYIWLLYGQVTTMKFTRNMKDAIWGALNDRFERVQDTVDLGVFKANPSPLCGWCAAQHICPDAKPNRRRP